MLACRFKEQEREELALLGPPHPGEIIREDILPRLKMSRKALAQQLGVSKSTVTRLLSEKRRISAKLAFGLAEVTGVAALYWLVLQAHHDAWIEQQRRKLKTKRPRRAHRRQRQSRKPAYIPRPMQLAAAG